jgi:hypothetical protein
MRRILRQPLAERIEQRLLQREDERRGFGRRETLHGAAGGEVVEHLAGVVPWRRLKIGRPAFHRLPQQRQESPGLFGQLRAADPVGAKAGCAQLRVDPSLSNPGLVVLKDFGKGCLLAHRAQMPPREPSII